MVEDRYFLNVGCELLLEKKPKQKVLMASPTSLVGVSAYEIWERLLGQFGKCEVETWVAEEIIYICMKAAAEGRQFADFSRISEVTVLCNIFDENEFEVFMDKDFFKKRFCNLPIFRILKETEDRILLDYIQSI